MKWESYDIPNVTKRSGYKLNLRNFLKYCWYDVSKHEEKSHSTYDFSQIYDMLC